MVEFPASLCQAVLHKLLRYELRSRRRNLGKSVLSPSERLHFGGECDLMILDTEENLHTLALDASSLRRGAGTTILPFAVIIALKP